MNGPVDSGAPGARRLRGCLLAGLTALLTAAGHLAGGGALPDLGPLAVLLPALAWPLVAVADRCRGLLGTTFLLGSGQLVLHELLATLHTHHHAHAAVTDDGAMFAMHAVVTVLTVLALRHAERGMAALGAAVRRVVPCRPAAPVADRLLAVLVVPDPAVPAGITRILAATHVRRGPPVCC
jgi:hypothetical protein